MNTKVIGLLRWEFFALLLSSCFAQLIFNPNTSAVNCGEFELLSLSLVSPVITIQREPVSAVSSDINFPMKGRRGMKDWARTAEDKLYIPKEVFTNPTEGRRNKTDIHCLGFVQTLGFFGANLCHSVCWTVTVR